MGQRALSDWMFGIGGMDPVRKNPDLMRDVVWEISGREYDVFADDEHKFARLRGHALAAATPSELLHHTTKRAEQLGIKWESGVILANAGPAAAGAAAAGAPAAVPTTPVSTADGETAAALADAALADAGPAAAGLTGAARASAARADTAPAVAPLADAALADAGPAPKQGWFFF